MIVSKAYDIEVLPNFFSIVIVDVTSYLNVFKDACNIKIKKGKEKRTPIPLVQKYTVAEIKTKLATVEKKRFYITDTDDSQLLPMLSYINSMRIHKNEKGVVVRTDMFGYNSKRYDKLMMAALLMYATNTNSCKELITKLYETSRKIIDTQDDRDAMYKDYFLNSLKRFSLPYTDVDVMLIFALNKVGKGYNPDGTVRYFPKGLKQTSINLQWYELLEHELPPISEKDVHFYHRKEHYRGMTIKQINTLVKKWDRYIIPEWIPPTMHYNDNDVFIVCEMIRLNIDEVRARYNISSAYEVDVLNSSRSNIADVLFEKFYSQFSGLHPSQWKGKRTERTIMAFNKVIFDNIKFKTKPLQELLAYMKTVKVTSVSKTAFMKEIKVGNLVYTIATGGLHTKDVPRELRSKLIDANSPTGELLKTIPDNVNDVWNMITDDSYIYVHFDANSFYPWIMAMYGVAPAHLNQMVFTKLIHWLASSRITAKHTDEAYIDGVIKAIFVLVLKIVINSIYGKLSFEKGELFDRLATLKVTINGQLMLMMVCEEFELNGIEVISANTDGIVVKLLKKQKQLYDDITKNWMEHTKLTADQELYELYINRDINNYVVRELNGSMTYKGALNPKMYLADLQKGYDMPIVAEAVVNYFLYDKPILETLYECRNILDFCKTQNVGQQYHVGFVPGTDVNDDFMVGFSNNVGKDGLVKKDGIIEIQRHIRYYVSTNGGVVYKIHNENRSKSRLAAGQKVTICNTLDDKRIELRNINYSYYYQECLKIIDPIKLGISPTTKADAVKGTKSGKSILAKNSGMYNMLFDEEES